MAFTTTTTRTGGDARIDLVGELDSTSAPGFRSVVEQAVEPTPERLVLDLSGLTYLSSAGLRSLVFARQKMGPRVDLVLLSPVPEVRAVIEMTGFQHSVQLEEGDSAPGRTPR